MRIILIIVIFCIIQYSNAIESCTAWNTWAQSSSSSLDYYDIAVDNSGKYQVTVVHNEEISGGFIYISSDYGSSWTATAVDYPGLSP